MMRKVEYYLGPDVRMAAEPNYITLYNVYQQEMNYGWPQRV